MAFPKVFLPHNDDDMSAIALKGQDRCPDTVTWGTGLIGTAIDAI
jgi:hypothetical protein